MQDQVVRERTRRSRQGRRARVKWFALSIAIALCADGIALAANERERPRASNALPKVVRAVEAARRGAPIPTSLRPPIATIKRFPKRYRIAPACIGHNGSSTIASRICHVGRPSSDKRLVLLGDSHAFMWIPAVLELARRDSWDVVPLIRFGCTPGSWVAITTAPTCRTWFSWSRRQARRLRPDVILLTGRVSEDPSPLTRAEVSGMIAGARKLRALGPVVVIGDPEGLSIEPVGCVLSRSATLATCTTTWPPASLAAYWQVARGVMSLGVGFLPTRGFTCYERQCPAVVGRTFVWMDHTHLTGTYSASLAGPFREAFLRARP